MTRTGDHGGSSDDEVEALLFAYSKGRPFIPTHFDDSISQIHQIDLAPTLAAILGLPIPYSNLGTIVFQLIPEIASGNLQRFQFLHHYLWQNARQVYSYIKEYSQQDENFMDEILTEFLTNFDVFEFRAKLLTSEEAFLSFSKDMKHELHTLLGQCRTLWVQFNPHLMTQGLVLSFVVICVMFFLTFGIPLKDFSKMYTKKFSSFLIAFNILSIMLAFIVQSFVFVHENLLSNVFLISIGNILIFVFAAVKNWALIAGELHLNEIHKQIMPRFHLIVLASIFFSNSFIVREQKILGYSLAGQIIFLMFDVKSSPISTQDETTKANNSSWKNVNRLKIVTSVVVTAVLIRLAFVFAKCREEQRECWEEIAKASSDKSVTNELQLIPIVTLITIVISSRVFLKACGNLTGFSFHVIFIKFGLVLSLVAASAHLILTQKNFKTSSIPPAHLDILAQIVFGIFIIDCIIVIVNPLMLHLILNDSSNPSSMVRDRNSIPEMFRLIKNNMFNRKPTSVDNVPIVYGLASLYSSVFIAFATCLTIVIAIVLGKSAINGFLLTVAIAILLIFISSMMKFQSSLEFSELINPSFGTVMAWTLLTSFGFYATSHQPTISQIEWDAAFVGRKASFDHSSPISALLVLLNTFNCNILFYTIYPLLVIVPFSIGAVFPSLSRRVNKAKDEKTKLITFNEPDFDIGRGEINLLENDNYFMSSVFRVGCQLLILQGIKCFAAMLACTILCRHLMVWKIFAPRFIYEGIATYITLVCIVIGYAITLRIHQSARNFVDKINERKNV